MVGTAGLVGTPGTVDMVGTAGLVGTPGTVGTTSTPVMIRSSSAGSSGCPWR